MEINSLRNEFYSAHRQPFIEFIADEVPGSPEWTGLCKPCREACGHLAQTRNVSGICADCLSVLRDAYSDYLSVLHDEYVEFLQSQAI